VNRSYGVVWSYSGSSIRGGGLPSAGQQKKREKEERGGVRFVQFGKTTANTNSTTPVSGSVVSGGGHKTAFSFSLRLVKWRFSRKKETRMRFLVKDIKSTQVPNSCKWVEASNRSRLGVPSSEAVLEGSHPGPRGKVFWNALPLQL